MSAVPILRLGRALVATLRSDLTDSDLLEFEEEILERVGAESARGVILDLTASDVLDSFGARVLRDIAAGISLRGARAVVVGIQPEVALAMVTLGLDLEGVRTALDLERGLALLERS
ncbi:MAG: STAS domain-containing protein [Myxococcota bacterium]